MWLELANSIKFLFDYRQVLEDMEMLSAFTATLHVPNLSKPDHLLSVLDEQPELFSKKDMATLAKRMSGHKYVAHNFVRIF